MQSWRRQYDVLPPPITSDNPYYHSIRNNPSFKNIPAAEFPDTESLKVLMQRVIPYFENIVFKQVLAGKRVLIIAHGTVARALIKHIDSKCPRYCNYFIRLRTQLLVFIYISTYMYLWLIRLYVCLYIIAEVSDENISTVNVPNSIPCVFEFNMETGEKVGKTTFLADENFLNEQIQKTASIGESNKWKCSKLHSSRTQINVCMYFMKEEMRKETI